MVARLKGGLQLKIQYDSEEKKVDIGNDATVSDLKDYLKGNKTFPTFSILSFAGLEMKLTDKLSSYSLKDGDVIDVSKEALKSGNGLILSYKRCEIT